MKVKGYSWVGVGTDDFDSTLAFFTRVIGLRPAVVDDRRVAILSVSDGQVLEIFGPGTRGRELTSPPVVAFEVEDVAAARDELLLNEVEILGEIGSWNGFEWLKFRGPGRARFRGSKNSADRMGGSRLIRKCRQDGL